MEKLQEKTKVKNIKMIKRKKVEEEFRRALFSQIFTSRNIIIYLLVINIVNFWIMWYDKHEAKKQEWRVSEKTLFILTLLGGSIGGIVGMYAFHHKTKKWYFKYGYPIILICQILLGMYLCTIK